MTFAPPAAPSNAGPTTPPRMVVCDMDGTLLDETGARVSKRNADALARAESAGARVVIATGRPIWWLDPVIEAGFTGIAVCMNGAVVYDVQAGELVAASPLVPQVMQDFVSALELRTDPLALAVERLGTTIRSCWAEAHYDHPWEFGEFQTADRAALLADPAAKMLVRGGVDSRTLAEAAHATGNPDVSITWSTDEGLLEIAAAGVSKGSALDRLAGDWGIDPAEVVAFGDMPNDLEMLRWAGRGVAMAGGHPDVRAIATEIAPEHYHDGVAAVLERWF
ncbi:HAD family hydrolase [Nakamurella alba]|uniref:HAD family hydrolase n=1 Tax=Nakamurella alba TaxID=2665158 RepID=UPI0018A8F493|nr:HAD family hydrolase [Nakamurella alba]